ncbi:hypothetical protein GJ744_002726 [Endocarpon pusillum]|uniref:Uncharacterized protein n=1 Tax=Endocarpon pusillum TaxID=364733 RepID=A0A8H7AMW6_9EURO|nr:hypothetical protein GJ744_002726 [Endocarpon pusillum]
MRNGSTFSNGRLLSRSGQQPERSWIKWHLQVATGFEKPWNCAFSHNLSRTGSQQMTKTQASIQWSCQSMLSFP